MTELVNLIQNEMKNQNLMVAQQIEQVKGDLQRIFDEMGFEDPQQPEE